MSEHPSDPAMKSLIEGYKTFRSKYFGESKSLKQMVSGKQHPKTLVIACSDSRVDPAILLGSKPGELFVVRNVANLVPPFEGHSDHQDTKAALEFGVLGLKVEHIVIIGHGGCGGIRALMEAPTSFKQVEKWMEVAKPVKKQVLKEHPENSLDEKAHYCEKDSTLNSLKNLETYPWIKERVQKKELSLHAWYFELSSGILSTYQKDQDKFIPLDS